MRLGVLIKLYSVGSVVDSGERVNRYLGELAKLAEGCSVNLLQAAASARIATATVDFEQAAAAWQQAMAFAAGAGFLRDRERIWGKSDQFFILGATSRDYARALIEHGHFLQAEQLARESLAACRARGYVSNRRGARHFRTAGVASGGTCPSVRTPSTVCPHHQDQHPSVGTRQNPAIVGAYDFISRRIHQGRADC